MRIQLRSLMSFILAIVVLPLALGGGSGYAEESGMATYRVTIQNLTSGQPFSPPVAATHDGTARVFRVGEMASAELEAIAEDGIPDPMAGRLSITGGVTDAVNVSKPVAVGGGELMVMGMKLPDATTFEIKGAEGDSFSIAAMLVCTNDGFMGLDSVELPESGSAEYMLKSYDAGTENNTEQSKDIVDHCTEFGAMKLDGDPNGNVGMGPMDAPISTDPANEIRAHEGIRGTGDLSVETHAWNDTVGKITITRMDVVKMPSTGGGGMAGGGLATGSLAAFLSLLAVGGFAVLRCQR